MKYLRIAGVMLILLVCGMLSSLAAAAELEGYVMPLVCDKREPDRGPTHTTECALKPECVKGGFGLWTAESITKFDARGNELALHYFKTNERQDHHKVRVIGDLEGDTLHVKDILPIED